MRHGKKINHLSRTASHRGALMSNMAASLILHKRINTTVAKAKALRKYVEPLLTKAKTNSTHSRRIVFSYLQNKFAVTELFRDVAEKIADRPGGYTRIIRTGYRPGDAADMCMMELVDYNTIYTKDKDKAPAKKAKTTRRRGGKKTKAAAATAETTETAVEATEPKAEAKPKKASKKKKADSGEDTEKPADE